MKFKEIKPGMVIHCLTEEDAKALINYLYDIDYSWDGSPPEGRDETLWHLASRNGMYYRPNSNMSITWNNVEREDYTTVEFSDLIEPDDSPTDSPTDSPMSAVEVLEWIVRHDSKKEIAEIFDTDAVCFSDLLCRGIPVSKILDTITAYEAKKAKPKPVEYGKHLAIVSSEGDSLFAKEFWFNEYEESYEDYKADKMEKFANKIDGEVITRERDICRVVKE